MSQMKGGSFNSEYTTVEVIKSKKNKKISIVRNSKGFYFIAKKLQLNDQSTIQEISMMKTLRHPNIVACHNIIEEKGHVYLIQDYCEEGDLAFHIRRQIRKKRAYFQESLVAKWMLQLLLAIQNLHSLKILHRDIRPHNIFLTSEGNVKLGSFRASKMLQNEKDLAQTVIGSPYYMAPECMQNSAYNEKVDIWAFGCVLYEVCSLISIFNTKNMVELANKIMKGSCGQLPGAFSKQLNNILQKCLKKKPFERPSAKQLLRTSYFLEAIQTLISNKSPVNFCRIPIKRYKVHIENLERAKVKDRNCSREKTKKSARQSTQKQHILPKIGGSSQTQKPRRKGSVERMRQKSRQLSRQKINDKKSQENPIFQKQRPYLRVTSRSKEKRDKKEQKQDCSKKLEGVMTKVRSKEIKNQSKGKINQSDTKFQKKEKVSLKIPKAQKNKTEKLQTENSEAVSPPLIDKNILLPPPMLPKPNKRSESKEKLDFSDTANKDRLSQQLSIFRSKNEDSSSNKKLNYAEENAKVKESLQSIFKELNIKEEEEQEFSFELEDQNMARLTMKANDGEELIETYKTKLDQLIEEINYKYCPNMETIQERTQEYDSNTFKNIRKL